MGLTKAYENLWVPWYGGAINTARSGSASCTVASVSSSSRIPTTTFSTAAFIYGQNDDVMRFAFFCRAALEFMFKTDKHPDVIHCHDWQTALVPVLLYEMYQHLGMRHRACASRSTISGTRA